MTRSNDILLVPRGTPLEATPRDQAMALRLRAGLPTLLFLSTLLLQCQKQEDAQSPKAAVESGAPSTTTESSLTILPLRDAIRDLPMEEEFSEAIAHQLVDWADSLRDGRKFPVHHILSESFQGTFASVGPLNKPDDLGIARGQFIATPKLLNRDEFVAALQALGLGFRDLDDVRWKVVEGNFELSPVVRGLLRLRLKLAGRASRSIPAPMRAYSLEFEAEAIRGQRGWLLSRLRYLDGSGKTLHGRHALFTDVTSAVGMERQAPRFGRPGNDSFHWRGGAAGDIDGDGRVDFFLPSSPKNHLFRNQGDGRFEDVAEQLGVASPPGEGGPLLLDLDGDDDLDLVLPQAGWIKADGSKLGASIQLFENLGDRFRAVQSPAGFDTARTTAFSMSAADIDGDSDLDLFVTGYGPWGRQLPRHWYNARDGAPNLLFINQGKLRFREEAELRGAADSGWAYAAAFADYDADGDPDLYVANDYGPNVFLQNDGKGHFQKRGSALGIEDVGQGMAVTWGDVDSDGHLDLYVGNMASSAGKRIMGRLNPGQGGQAAQIIDKMVRGNTLYRSNGQGGFVPITQQACGCLSTSWTWSTVFFDANLDGRDDLFVTNGFISGDSVKDT